jgi:hypothetical protein
MSSLFRTNTVPYRHEESTTWLELFFDLAAFDISWRLRNPVTEPV